MAEQGRTLVHEVVGGKPYEYYLLGDYVVAAPGVCGGEPTFKYTRISLEHALGLVKSGWTVEEVARVFKLSVAAVQEAVVLNASG